MNINKINTYVLFSYSNYSSSSITIIPPSLELLELFSLKNQTNKIHDNLVCNLHLTKKLIELYIHKFVLKFFKLFCHTIP